MLKIYIMRRRMDLALKAAAVGFFLNIALALIIPMIPRTNVDFVDEIITMAKHHRRTMVSSSLLVAVAVYLSIYIAKRI
tara:strand:- start:162 stop:398 length:237 start_codon:yes stop_codon:yes gene_type:complete